MILRAAPVDVSRTRHALGAPGTPGARMVPAFTVRPSRPQITRERAVLVGVLD